jgi:uncharacterized circularly permuted ATP-grasp superfamily protein/uncharacterized alpha-E superfamily protein
MAETTRTSPSTPASTGVAVGPWNEVTDAAGHVRPHWQGLDDALRKKSPDQRAALAAAAGRRIEDLGTTFNVFRDAGGADQPYELDPVPLIISAKEWEKVSAGLAQRARLIDAVLRDLYGPQTLLEKGFVPPDFVHSCPAFLNCAHGVQPPGGAHLSVLGCDLVRAPSGAWMVLGDHTVTPGGLGQTMENRNVVSELFDDAFEALQVAPLGDFVRQEGRLHRNLAVNRRDAPHVVFLTPGFRHPSYFEHAYKARMLGFPLVEAADLTVRERRLFLKTLAGLRRVDVVLCRVPHDKLDPLEMWSGGGDGVPGIMEVWRAGNVVITNAPGSGIASSPALLPFLPRICREWFGEDLKLPFVETWWLGQAPVRQRVLNDLSRYILLSASPKGEPGLPLQCSTLAPAVRNQWLRTIQSRPHDFVAQLEIRPSECPSIQGRESRALPVVWRGFATLDGGRATVLPGGLARVGKSQHSPQLWPTHAGFTKDVWVAGSSQPETGEPVALTKQPRAHGHEASPQEVPSRIGEQLFWVGRYAERVELATRLLRVSLRRLGGEAGRLQTDSFQACILLLQGTGTLAKDTTIQPAHAIQSLAALIHDPAAEGGIASLVHALLQNAAAARDRLSDDTWRFFNRLETIVRPPDAAPTHGELAATLDRLILHLAAFAGMQAENMTRGHGWRFLEIGRRIERALGTVALLESAAENHPAAARLPDPLLETCDSVMTYRRRHFSAPQLDAVVEMLFRDSSNPRSVAFQIAVIHQEIPRLPDRSGAGLMPRIAELAAEMAAATNLTGLTDTIEQFSDALTQHFFSHSVRRVY